MIKALVVVLVLALVGTGAVWWLWAADDQTVTIDAIGDQNQTVARGQLPVFAARGDTARLYTFALENPDTLGTIPCTCGCDRFGHSSNRVCYIKEERAERVTFTSHAAT